MSSCELYSTLPLCELFYLRHKLEFQKTKFERLFLCRPALFLPGEGGRSPHASAFCKAPNRKSIGPLCSGLLFMEHRAENKHLDSLVQPASPLCLGTQVHQSTTVFLVTSGILRPCCHIWDSALLYHLSAFKLGMSLM